MEIKGGFRRALLLAGIFGIGFFVSYRHFVPPLQSALQEAQSTLQTLQTELQAEKSKPPQIKTETKTRTEIAYVPKETIIYKDAATGAEKSALEQTDVAIDVAAPTVHLRYNGKDYSLPGVVGETEKFSQGKLVGEFSTLATLDVTGLVESETQRRLAEREKDFALGGYLTNRGFVGSIGLVRGDREYKFIGKVPKIKEFYGMGLEVRF